ncbi:aldehyde reductase [Niastella vici]|uniref:Aldehyde reductase n=1 Tax=Niastella vici TaxID=1703345 RepID=A0A1V9FR08_9BACT|nr:iron-containing alcohol dehydrogenase [Niastella vici]OQP60721.1 aldehyde reductase [Niastella vici]
MLNFQFRNPTKLLFGKNQIANLASEIASEEKILVLYGGGSIKKNGIYDQVTDALKNHQVLEFGGIPPNPEYSVLLKALELIKREKITFLLAVGGGSVIDGTKFLSAAAAYQGTDPWQIMQTKKVPDNTLPFGTVLTLPATGSEMNSRAVITREDTQEKLSIRVDALYPRFSILDPQVIQSIPQNQIANGLADSFTHVLEQYMTYPVAAYLQDRIAESILKTIIEIAPRVMSDPADYEAAANYMWCCTMALNDLIEKGVPTDWAIHMMGHELTALYHIDHARTLAILTKSHYEYNLESKKEKLAQYAARVWDIKKGSTEERAMQGIEQTECFFHSLGIKTRLSDYTPDYNGTAEKIEKTFLARGWEKIGENRTLTPGDVKQIVAMAY